ncbi:hypothetical protein AB0425_25795 [Actinosynnema sp. NPDC051121]
MGILTEVCQVDCAEATVIGEDVVARATTVAALPGGLTLRRP